MTLITKAKENIKLNKSYNNFYSIINKNLPHKFSYLDRWLLKKSKLLLNESNHINDEIKYKVYKRGTIIKVDFGVNLGSEMSQVHFAIVLNKYDNPSNNVLTVVPLTSKQGKYNLDLGSLIINKLLYKMLEERKKIEKNDFYDYKIVKKLNLLQEYYKNNIKSTYACCSLITTISKKRILSPINEYDIMGKTRCSDEVMNKIDRNIIEKFTKNL